MYHYVYIIYICTSSSVQITYIIQPQYTKIINNITCLVCIQPTTCTSIHITVHVAGIHVYEYVNNIATCFREETKAVHIGQKHKIVGPKTDSLWEKSRAEYTANIRDIFGDPALLGLAL